MEEQNTAKLYTLCVEMKTKPGRWIRFIKTLPQLKTWLDAYVKEAASRDYQHGSRFYVEPHQPHHVDGEETSDFPL